MKPLKQKGRGPKGKAMAIPAWLPAGAVWHCDVENGQFWADGSERTIGDLLHPANLVVLSNSGPMLNGSPLTLGILNSLANGGFSAVCDFDAAGPNASGVLGLYGDPNPPSAALAHEAYFFFSASPADYRFRVDDWNEASPGSNGHMVPSARNKVAFTIGRDIGGGQFESAVALNGVAGQTQSVGYSIASHLGPILYTSFFWMAAYDAVSALNGTVRSMTIYEPVAPADLVGLSVLI